MVQAVTRLSPVTRPGTNRLTRVFGQVLLDGFLSFRSIFPNLCDVGNFQSAVVPRRERRGVLLQPPEETVLLEVEPIEYLRLHHPNANRIKDLLSWS